jgi:hypothetical protein
LFRGSSAAAASPFNALGLVGAPSERRFAPTRLPFDEAIRAEFRGNDA